MSGTTGMWEATVRDPEESCYTTEVYADTLLHAVLKLMAEMPVGSELIDVARRGWSVSNTPDQPVSELFAALRLP